MICNESLLIPKSFPFSSQSSFVKKANFNTEPAKPIPTQPQPLHPKMPTSLMKLQQSRFVASQEEPMQEYQPTIRKIEQPKPQYETPKRQRHHNNYAQYHSLQPDEILSRKVFKSSIYILGFNYNGSVFYYSR